MLGTAGAQGSSVVHAIHEYHGDEELRCEVLWGSAEKDVSLVT